jgi:hypothetical protein
MWDGKEGEKVRRWRLRATEKGRTEQLPKTDVELDEGEASEAKIGER